METKYIMTVSCLFSKCPEATALSDETATGVAVSFFCASQDMAVVRLQFLIKVESL